MTTKPTAADLDAIEALLTNPVTPSPMLFAELRVAAPSLLASARREARLEALLKRAKWYVVDAETDAPNISTALRNEIAKELT